MDKSRNQHIVFCSFGILVVLLKAGAMCCGFPLSLPIDHAFLTHSFILPWDHPPKWEHSLYTLTALHILVRCPQVKLGTGYVLESERMKEAF